VALPCQCLPCVNSVIKGVAMKKLLLILSIVSIILSGCIVRAQHDDGYHRGHHHDRNHDRDRDNDDRRDGRGDGNYDGRY